MMKHLRSFWLSVFVVVSVCLISQVTQAADGTLLGLNTDGTIFQVDPKTGGLTQKAQEAFTSFSLGAIARKKNKLYYIVAPSGTSENALFVADSASGVISHVDLDRSGDDDEVRDLFFHGAKLYGVFYNSNQGTGGVYKINIKTGKTTVVVDLSSLDIDPIGGAISRVGNFIYLLGRPDSDYNARKLVRFKLKANSAVAFDIATAAGTPVNCDRIKLNIIRQNFVCLASPSTTSVEVCRLTPKGKATCLTTLSGVERVAGGHSMLTPNGKTFYAFVYAPGDSNSQRLVNFTANGGLKKTSTVGSIIIGARFGLEDEVPAA